MNQTQSSSSGPKSGLKEQGLSSFCIHIVRSFERGFSHLSVTRAQTFTALDSNNFNNNNNNILMGSFHLEKYDCCYSLFALSTNCGIWLN